MTDVDVSNLFVVKTKIFVNMYIYIYIYVLMLLRASFYCINNKTKRQTEAKSGDSLNAM